MRSGYKALAALCSLAISVNTGCSGSGTSSAVSGESAATALPTGETSDMSVAAVFHQASEKDLSPSAECASAVAFTSTGVQCMGSGVSADGNVVTISAAGSYSISGTCADGQIIIDCGKLNAYPVLLAHVIGRENAGLLQQRSDFQGTALDV